MKSLAYLESMRRGLKGERDLALLSSQQSKDRHTGGVQAQLEVLAEGLRVQLRLEIRDLRNNSPTNGHRKKVVYLEKRVAAQT